ncbi:hypothetical protein [Shewanella sp. HL-SH2]|uniref:hypothetical protein n=1 Tax=Shewanella sp. HL-SH2 TaxID=3436238 RepID=UPI003EBA33ED
MIMRFFLFFIFFLAVYLEPLSIFGVKVSLLWKAALLGAIFIYSISDLRITKLNLISYLYSLKHIISFGAIHSFFESFMELVKTSTIPLILHFFSTLYNRSPKQAERVVNQTISFVSISLLLFNIPFVFGFLPELSSGIALTALGGDETGYSGPFQNGHAASITMGAVGLYFLYKITVQKDKVMKYLYCILLVFALFIIFKTLVRTGLLMILIGLLTFLYSFYGIRWFIKFTPFLILIILVLTLVVSNNEAIMLRLFDGSVYEREHEHWFYNVGSGRLWMGWTNLVYWFDSGLFGWVFGTGIGPSKDNMEAVVGIRVFSHNGFVDALTHNGLIGLYLYIMILSLSYKLIRNCKGHNKNMFALAVSMFVSYLLFVLFQGGSRFFLDVLFVLSILQLKYCGISNTGKFQ